MTSNYLCKNCKYMETDQLGDMVCTNPRSLFYHQYIEEELEQLDECDYFVNLSSLFEKEKYF